MKLIKEILPVGTYKVRTKDGQRILQTFTEDRLNNISNTSNNMLTSGLRIPAPFDHKEEARPQTEIEMDKAASSFQNAGYWKRFWVAPNKKGVPTLHGEIDAPGDESDKDSPAYKVKNTNEEVSVALASNFEDGLGRSWTDGLLHVAVVNHAVVPDQAPFTVVNMSMLEPGSSDESIIEEIKSTLPKVGVSLPVSTNASTFLRDLLVALTQVKENNNYQDPIEPVPVYMSTGADVDMKMTKEAAQALVDAKIVNPDTSKPYTMAELGFQEQPPAQTPNGSDHKELLASLQKSEDERNKAMAIVAALKNKIVDDTKATIQKRITALVKAGIISKDEAEASFNPKVEFQMSVMDGKIQDHPLETTLSALEAVAARNGKKPAPTDFPVEGVVELNTDPTHELSDDEMNKALEALAADGLL